MYIKILNTIHELTQEGIKTTKEYLLTIGITEDQINYLLDNNLIYESNGTYKLASVKELFQYGKTNLLQGQKRIAQDTFLLCYKIKPKHRDTCLQLFYSAIIHRDYPSCYKYLYALEHVSTQEHMRKDYKIYLFLLSQVSVVPENYQEKLEAINNDRNLITHKKPDKQQRQDNKVMELVQKNKYKFAIESLNNFLAESYEYEIHRLIIKNLIAQIIDLDEKYKKQLLDLVHKKRYREIISMLESISLTRELRTDESSILEVTKAIISIFETNEIPIPIPNEATSTKDAISYYDYAKALDLEANFLLSKDIPFDKSSIYFLLYEINKLMGNIQRLKDNNIPIGPTNTLS